MAKKKKPKAVRTWAPDRRIKPKVPDDLKAEVQAKADDLVERVLKPRYIKPPPKKPRWNYPTALWTKWHRSFFYFVSVAEGTFFCFTRLWWLAFYGTTEFGVSM